MEEFSTSDISDALTKLGHSKFYVKGIKSLDSSTPRLCGPAFTIQCLTADSEILEKHKTTYFLDNAPSNCVIVMANKLEKESVNALWGGLMTVRAKYLGVSGVIVDGLCRDKLELIDKRFPVYCKGTSCLGASKLSKQTHCNTQVFIEGVEINPGDYIVGDTDGIVVVPSSLTQSVVEECKKLVNIEIKCIKDLEIGVSLEESFRRHR
jgi:regulator of RNase E activity RraA